MTKIPFSMCIHRVASVKINRSDLYKDDEHAHPCWVTHIELIDQSGKEVASFSIFPPHDLHKPIPLTVDMTDSAIDVSLIGTAVEPDWHDETGHVLEDVDFEVDDDMLTGITINRDVAEFWKNKEADDAD